jgi:hypothetical protein
VTLLEKLKALFTRAEVPDDAKALFASAKTTRDLLRGLDDLVTRNELELEDVNREIAKIEGLERIDLEKIRAGLVDGRSKQQALRKIARYRKQMDNYESRTRIFNRNIDLLQQLIAKIQEIEAMKLRGVDEHRIDQILMEHGEELEKYTDTMAAADLANVETTIAAKEERELAALEAEILKDRDKDKDKDREKEREAEAARAREREREVEAARAREREQREQREREQRERAVREAAARAVEAKAAVSEAAQAAAAVVAATPAAAATPGDGAAAVAARRPPLEEIDAAIEAEARALEAEQRADAVDEARDRRERELELE